MPFIPYKIYERIARELFAIQKETSNKRTKPTKNRVKTLKFVDKEGITHIESM
jgi:hypothetical protein